MSREGKEDKTVYKVVVNREGRYSIWPADRENAIGWKDAGRTGTKQECDDFINKAARDKPLPPRS